MAPEGAQDQGKARDDELQDDLEQEQTAEFCDEEVEPEAFGTFRKQV